MLIRVCQKTITIRVCQKLKIEEFFTMNDLLFTGGLSGWSFFPPKTQLLLVLSVIILLWYDNHNTYWVAAEICLNGLDPI